MSQTLNHQCWMLGLVGSLAVSGVIAFTKGFAWAQMIEPDDTLGAERSVVNPNPNINSSPSNLIEGGVRRGENLFHSFEKFNVDEGQGIYFDNPTGVERIFSRVTGHSRSEILGTLGVWNNAKGMLGKADLLLINPNGIIFGPNASLALNGSFLATTASSLTFADGTQFSATDPSSLPLLTVSLPIGLQFREIPVQITNQSQAMSSRGFPAGLEVQLGKTLALIGGNITSQGGIMVADEGRIELGSVITGQASLKSTEEGWAMSYEGVQNFGDIRLMQESSIGANGRGGGTIQLRGRRVILADGSRIFATVVEGAQSGGLLTVTASDSVELMGTDSRGEGSGLFTSTFSEGDAGNIQINTKRLFLQDGASISTESVLSDSLSKGRAGGLTVNASGLVELSGASQLSTLTQAFGDAGDLTINTEQLRVLEGSRIEASTFGQGRGGNILINAVDAVNLSGVSPDKGSSSGLFTTTEANAGNRGGAVVLNTRALHISDGAVISARTRSSFRGGDIEVNANTLELTSGGQILVTAFNTGAAGNIVVNTTNRVDLTGSDPTYTARLEQFGVEVDNNSPASGLFANTAFSGEGGNITLQLQDLLLLRHNSQISTTSSGTGKGGSIEIETPLLVGRENSDITANSFGGQGGAINITAKGVFGFQIRDGLTFSNDITAFSQQGAELNGTVTLNLPDIDLSQGLVELPETVVDPAAIIAQNPCRRNAASEFIITGRGGLPSNLSADFSSEAVQVGLVEPVSSPEIEAQAQRASLDTSSTQNPKPPRKTESEQRKIQNPIVPAQGWVFNDKGEVVLTAYNPTITGSQRQATNPAICSAPSKK